MCSDGQGSQLDYLKSLPEFKYEGASAEAILQALEEKTKPKSNEIAAFTKLCSLKQGDMPLSEFIHEARRLAELCKYPNHQDRLIRDMIVSGIQSLRAYQKCIDSKDCINICQVEDAIRMQVLECRPESCHRNRVHRLQFQSTSYKIDQDSLQTLTGTETRLHEAAITVGHKTRPESTPRYARPRTLSVVGVVRKGTLIHCVEVPGHPYPC